MVNNLSRFPALVHSSVQYAKRLLRVAANDFQSLKAHGGYDAIGTRNLIHDLGSVERITSIPVAHSANRGMI